MFTEDYEDNLRLTMVSGVGPRIRQRLLEYFGSASRVFKASMEELCRIQDVGPKISEAIYLAREHLDVASEIRFCRENGIQILLVSDPGYPHLLKEIADPPGVLFVRGSLLPQDSISLGVVGTRHPTRYGENQTRRLVGQISRAGFTVVSGLARGIDSAAHRGALEAQGRTVAILGQGLATPIYPPENSELADEIIKHGALISEVLPRMEIQRGMFPQRNRIISGMTLGTLVVEAGERSGALITARSALEQNREVFAVPGPIDSRVSTGCHRLIRDGAKLTESVDDILEELGPMNEHVQHQEGLSVHHPAELSLSEPEKQILSSVESDGATVDQIVQRTGLMIHNVMSMLTMLEMKRLIKRGAGQRIYRI